MIKPILSLPLLLTVACGGAQAPAMSIGKTCTLDGLTAQVETGAPVDCMGALYALVAYRDAYEAKWGPVDVPVIRIRNAADLRDVGVPSEGATSGHTYSDAIDLGTFAFDVLPHELNHIRTGPSHDGWCVDYEPWIESEFGINERSYLGCH